MRSGHRPFVDWMKAIGMLLIVYGHVATAAPFNTVPPINTKQLGVAFFLFVTGFTLARETRERWRVVFNRLFEVYLFGAAVALVASAIAYTTSGTIAKSNYLPFVLGVNVLFNFFPANPTTWYIGTYAHVLLLWAVVCRRYRIRPWMLGASLCVEIVTRAALLAANLDLVAYMLVPNWATVFLLGMYQGQRAGTDDRRALAGYAGALTALVVGWGLVTRWWELETAFPFMRFAGPQTPATLLVTSACVSFVYVSYTWLTFEVTRRIETRRVVTFMARNTLFIFIAHMPVYYALVALMRGWTTSYWLRAGLRLVVCFVVLAMVSEALTRVLAPRALRAEAWKRLHLITRPLAARVAALVLAVLTALPGTSPGGQAVDSTPSPSASAPASGPRLQPSSLVYRGAFRLPRGRFCKSPRGVADSFAYGGTALAHDPTRNGLYLVGHDQDQMTAEISIPTIVNSTTLGALDTATVIQGCVDATEGRIAQAGDGAKIGGHMVYNGMLYGTVYVYYDAGKSQTVSHFVRPLDLSATGRVGGLFQVGAPHAGFVAGYLGPIPSEWQAALGGPAFTGQCCIPIVSRTSYGPAAFAFDPARLGVGRFVPTVPLVYYEHDGERFVNDWNVQSEFFNGATAMGGAVFVPGTRTLLFLGRQGIGPFCYGFGGASGGDCHDPTSAYKGTHAYPYVYQVWAYDAEDLAPAASRRRRPWMIRPYRIWRLDLPFGIPAAELKGATYDPATRRLFVSQAYADGRDMPVIYVFEVNF